TPDVLTDDTADLALALMLAVARRMGEGERQLRAGGWAGWRPTHLMGTRVTGKTIGIVGFGRIGQAVARRARSGFGMSVLFASRRSVADEVAVGIGAEQRSLDALLAEADFVSLHVPATPETYHLIDARHLRMMQRHSFLINTARGDVVDEVALIDALQAGTIAGAGLDVYEQEPSVPEALIALTNVVLLPHLGSATMESRTAMGLRAMENLVAFFEGREPADTVV
ncbi:MAG: NAD(P)-dependent oxidoreductase, partial [Gemmatimonadales bacterium]